jgi:hypothetical protein
MLQSPRRDFAFIFGGSLHAPFLRFTFGAVTFAAGGRNDSGTTATAVLPSFSGSVKTTYAAPHSPVKQLGLPSTAESAPLAVIIRTREPGPMPPVSSSRRAVHFTLALPGRHSAGTMTLPFSTGSSGPSQRGACAAASIKKSASTAASLRQTVSRVNAQLRPVRYSRRVPIARSVCFAAALALLAPAAHAQEDLINPDRPGIADGSGTLRRGVFQIEAGAERDDQSGSRTLITPALFRYGVTDRFELRVETAGWAHTDHASGLSPVSVGAKLSLQEGLGVIARVFPPSGSGAFRSHQTAGDLRLAADKSFGEKWAINPNVGLAFDEDGRRISAGLAALTVQYNLSPRLNVFADGGLTANRGGDADLLLDGGTAWIVGRDTQLDASIGWGAHGGNVPNVFFAAGISRRF